MAVQHDNKLRHAIDFANRDSFAAFTLRERMPRVVRMIEALPHWSSEARNAFAALRESLPNGRVPFLAKVTASDAGYWEVWLRSRFGSRWIDLTFMEAEFAFYRILFEVAGTTAGDVRDPYLEQKTRDLEQALQGPASLAEVAAVDAWTLPNLSIAVFNSLFGNSADLSQIARGTPGASGHLPLANDLPAFFLDLSAAQAPVIDVILDNAGEELVSDLALAAFFLRTLPAVRVRLHAKPFPMFVSDATIADVRLAIDAVAANHTREVSAPGLALLAYEKEGRLTVSADDFWGRPDVLADMPPSLMRQFQEATAVVLKGDLNYRRYVGDRDWAPTELSSLHRVRALPPTLSVRVLKSDVVVGLQPDAVAQVSRDDPEWRHNGRHSVIQYFR